MDINDREQLDKKITDEDLVDKTQDIKQDIKIEDNQKDKNCDNQKNLSEKSEINAKKEIENIDFKDKFLRVSADFQNYKRRIDKEREEWGLVAQTQVLDPFFTLIDELDMAISSSEKLEIVKNNPQILDGFKIIQKNLKKKLEELGIKEVEYIKFDPHFHEAIMEVDCPERESGDIVTVLSPGYIFKGVVIRHAKVSLAR